MVCEKGYIEIAHKLIDAKADVNLCDQVSNFCGVCVKIVLESVLRHGMASHAPKTRYRDE
jgi:hypothetical protein